MKKRVIMYNIFTAIIILCTSVYAVVNADLDFKFDTTKTYHKGDTVEITLALKGVEEAGGVDSIEGYINVDKNILEKVEYSSIVKDSNNRVIIKNQQYDVIDVNNDESDLFETYGVFFNGQVANNDCKIVIDLKNKVTTEDLLTIRFKIKDNVEPGLHENAITYKLFSLTGGISYQSPEITRNINIRIAESGNTNEPNNTTNTPNGSVENRVNMVNITDEPQNNVDDNPGASGIGNTNTNTPTGVRNRVNNIANANNSYNGGSSSAGTKNGASGTQGAGTKTSGTTNDATVKSGGLPAAGTTKIIIRIVILGAVFGYIIYRKYNKYRSI